MLQRLDAPALAARLADPADPPPLLLDVREPWEVALARIEVPGVRTWALPMGEVPGQLESLLAAPSVVCYCHHGVRSLQVVAFLVRQGHASVYNLEGGIDAWSQQVDPAVARY